MVHFEAVHPVPNSSDRHAWRQGQVGTNLLRFAAKSDCCRNGFFHGGERVCSACAPRAHAVAATAALRQMWTLRRWLRIFRSRIAIFGAVFAISGAVFQSCGRATPSRSTRTQCRLSFGEQASRCFLSDESPVAGLRRHNSPDHIVAPSNPAQRATSRGRSGGYVPAMLSSQGGSGVKHPLLLLLHVFGTTACCSSASRGTCLIMRLQEVTARPGVPGVVPRPFDPASVRKTCSKKFCSFGQEVPFGQHRQFSFFFQMLRQVPPSAAGRGCCGQRVMSFFVALYFVMPMWHSYIS
jgi:hypothetical protein|mmetsp:Transcript_57893/g.93409  ORF Transcript_57893/g.93409 Transcript_57893/m.93409 type:complete len:295 (-) Transcript_57893:367-1251(-)